MAKRAKRQPRVKLEGLGVLRYVDDDMRVVPDGVVVPELLRTLVFARPCGGDQFAAGTVSPSLDMSR